MKEKVENEQEERKIQWQRQKGSKERRTKEGSHVRCERKSKKQSKSKNGKSILRERSKTKKVKFKINSRKR